MLSLSNLGGMHEAKTISCDQGTVFLGKGDDMDDPSQRCVVRPTTPPVEYSFSSRTGFRLIHSLISVNETGRGTMRLRGSTQLLI